MLTRCPSCRNSTRVAYDQSEAHVRCPSCGHVFAARAPGGPRGSSGFNPITAVIIAGAVALVMLFIFLQSRDGEPDGAQARERAGTGEPVAAREKPVKVADETGWDSAPVRAVRALYDALHAGDREGARALLSGPRIAARYAALADAPAGGRSWDELEAQERRELLDGVLDELVTEESLALAAWEPYDGEVVALADEGATVRVRLRGRGPENQADSRNADFELVRERGGWLVHSYRRFLSEAEQRALRRAAKKPVEKVELTDGSQVWEAEPGPLEHLADTPPELRAEIDALYATLIDLEAANPRANATALESLVEIGKPALPVLLTGLYETPLETEEQAIQVNLINQALERITGHYTGYKPMLAEGSSVGTTEERRASAIRQWFAWWYRKGKRFTERERIDPFEGVIEANERDKRQMERDEAQSGRGS